MKVGFFGTPDIASFVLQRICSEHEIVFLVAPEDKKCGRNRHLVNCPAKEEALCRDIPVIQPGSLRDPDFLEQIQRYNADIFVVVAYGRLIPASVFKLPPLGTINLHPSLLPRYRGAAPVQWALINGDEITGVTVQMINEELDAGDIVVQEAIAVDEDMSAGELYEKVLPMGAELVLKAISLLSGGDYKLLPQDHSAATYCGKIDRDTAMINWRKPAREIHNLVRGLNPKPAAWTVFRGRNLKVWKTSVFREQDDIKLEPGEISKFGKKRLIAGTPDGIIEILQIQPENKKIMDGMSFINGYRLEEHEKFE